MDLACRLLLVPTILAAISCNQSSQYQKMVQHELDRGVRYDSLFLGYRFGMTRKEFISHSLELNKNKVVTGQAQVIYELRDLSHPATMRFYPEFKNNRIYKMPMEVSYNAWAPWNRHLYSDSLIVELLNMYENIYGPEFMKANHPNYNTEAWIKLDGNRMISIFMEDETVARVEFLDLLAGRD